MPGAKHQWASEPRPDGMGCSFVQRGRFCQGTACKWEDGGDGTWCLQHQAEQRAGRAADPIRAAWHAHKAACRRRGQRQPLTLEQLSDLMYGGPAPMATDELLPDIILDSQ
jgi:hypothetical protein